MKDNLSLRANYFILVVLSDWRLRLNYSFGLLYLSPTFDSFRPKVNGHYTSGFKTRNKAE
jgi:hypothetical protein